MRISDWSSDVCSSDLTRRTFVHAAEDVATEKRFRVTLGGHFGILARHGLFRAFPHNLLLSFLLLVACGCRHLRPERLLELLPALQPCRQPGQIGRAHV